MNYMFFLLDSYSSDSSRMQGVDRNGGFCKPSGHGIGEEDIGQGFCHEGSPAIPSVQGPGR